MQNVDSLELMIDNTTLDMIFEFKFMCLTIYEYLSRN